MNNAQTKIINTFPFLPILSPILIPGGVAALIVLVAAMFIGKGRG